MSEETILAVAVAEGSPSGIQLAKLGIGLRFQCQTIDPSHPWYLAVQVEWRKKDFEEAVLVDLMIPHRDVVMVAMKVPARMMGFHAG